MESHLLQMRGLKQNMQLAKYQNNWVASFTDAWIETTTAKESTSTASVASFTDAWIETQNLHTQLYDYPVASFTDAWIETIRTSSAASPEMSHLLQMRGLKLLS